MWEISKTKVKEDLKKWDVILEFKKYLGASSVNSKHSKFISHAMQKNEKK